MGIKIILTRNFIETIIDNKIESSIFLEYKLRMTFLLYERICYYSN